MVHFPYDPHTFYYPHLFFTRLSRPRFVRSSRNLSAPFPRWLQNDSFHKRDCTERISVSPCDMLIPGRRGEGRTDPGNGRFSKFFRVISQASMARTTSFHPSSVWATSFPRGRPGIVMLYTCPAWKSTDSSPHFVEF